MLLAGLAAFAIYKLSKMTGEERAKLAGNIKEKGRKLWDKVNSKNTFAQNAENAFEKSSN